LAIGDTGSAGWAGFLAAVGDVQVRQALGIDRDSRVVIVVTEGATDPAVYRSIVGRDAAEVMAVR
jgi:diaminopropionate ammonia-lyase